MIIANPIYDVVFKQLMQNTRIAKFFIETLLGEAIEELEMEPQEVAFPKELIGVAVKRYDFKAVIKTDTGEYKKVLIEIQKARNAEDLMRFRNYLAKQYATENEIKTKYGTVNEPLHIITIYLLGFNLHGIESAALKVARNYVDLLTNNIIKKKHE